MTPAPTPGFPRAARPELSYPYFHMGDLKSSLERDFVLQDFSLLQWSGFWVGGANVPKSMPHMACIVVGGRYPNIVFFCKRFEVFPVNIKREFCLK